MSSSDFAIGMITIDCTDPQRLAAFWSTATGSPVTGDYGEFVMVGSTPILGFQQVSDPTPGKNRIHIDGGGGARTDQVARLVSLGAVEHETRSLPFGYTWTVLEDPEGNVFCVGDPQP